MFTEVQGKPLRGILTNVQFNRGTGRCNGVLASPDFCEGEEGRNYLGEGNPIFTSTVESLDVVEGQLVFVTRNSAYIIEGSVGIWEVVLESAMAALSKTVLSKSEGGL